MVTLLQEIFADITKRKDINTILAVVSLILAVASLFFRASNIAILNFIIIINLVLVGWVFQVGWSERKKGGKPKILLISGIALGICVFQVLQLSMGLAQLAQFADQLQDLQHLIKK